MNGLTNIVHYLHSLHIHTTPMDQEFTWMRQADRFHTMTGKAIVHTVLFREMHTV